MSIAKKLQDALAILKEVEYDIENSSVALPPTAIDRIKELQTQALTVRNKAITLHRKIGWTLVECSHQFELSTARICQIALDYTPQSKPRIRTR